MFKMILLVQLKLIETYVHIKEINYLIFPMLSTKIHLSSMKNKTIVITGANSGLGYWTTLALAEKGARIFMLCRSLEKGEQVRQEFISRTRNSAIEIIPAELSEKASIVEAAKTILSKTKKIDILINNAALVSSKHTLTNDNIELTFAVNHLGPFYLTHLLFPLLLNSEDGRIINISSNNHRRGKIHFNNLNLSSTYNILKAYNQSKLANVLFSYELHKLIQLKNLKNLSVYCIDPGHNNTPIGLKTNNKLHYFIWLLRSKMGKSPKKGAECQVYAASEEKIKHISGQYWKNSKPTSPSPKSYDEHDAKKLWEISLKLCGIDEFFYPEL